VAAKDYFPLKKGLVLEYSSNSPEAASTFKDEIIAVVTKDGKTTATVRKTIEAPGKPPEVKEHKVIRDAKGIYEYGEKQLPLPINLDKTWVISPREYKITSLTETVTVPAGTFKDCLRVSYLIAGGDGGSGEIDYAAGVGNIRHRCDDEGEPFEYVLARWSK
jgi:hypothetical protein